MQKLRPAIAMIELIFAIVVIGIVLMSAPLLIQTSVKSGYVAVQQEAINEAATRMNMIMSYPWDENDADPLYNAPILHVTNGAPDLNEIGSTGKRKGMPPLSSRSFIRSDGTGTLFASSTLGSDGGDSDDIDDFIGDINLTLVETAKSDYIEKESININTAVVYASDTVGGYDQNDITYNPFGAGATSTNIKAITVTLTSDVTKSSEEMNKTITLQAFSCNIGSYELVYRDF